MSEIKRYDRDGSMYESKDGEYVLFAEYEKLQADHLKAYDELDEVNIKLNEEIKKLTRQRDIMKKALEFYANTKNWRLTGSIRNIRELDALNNYGEALEDRELFENYASDPFSDGKLDFKIGGKTARKALQEAGGIE